VLFSTWAGFFANSDLLQNQKQFMDNNCMNAAIAGAATSTSLPDGHLSAAFRWLPSICPTPTGSENWNIRWTTGKLPFNQAFRENFHSKKKLFINPDLARLRGGQITFPFYHQVPAHYDYPGERTIDEQMIKPPP
jgi:hypothetical protein